MPEILNRHDVVAALQAQAAALGLNVHEDPEGLAGEVESIQAKWWFGGRKAVYRMSCRPTDTDHTVHFREAVVERSWGIPPPTLTVETTSTSGWKRSGERKDISVGGGGTLNYAKVRDGMEKVATSAGWKFHLDGGRAP